MSAVLDFKGKTPSPINAGAAPVFHRAYRGAGDECFVLARDHQDPSDRLLDWVNYNRVWRPNCAFFVNAVCVSAGTLSHELRAQAEAQIRLEFAPQPLVVEPVALIETSTPAGPAQSRVRHGKPR